MPSLNYECKELQWDTDYFNVNSARVNINGIIDKHEQFKVLEFCNKYDFVTISNMGNIKENNYWIGNSTNAFLTDINIQFAKILPNKVNYANDKVDILNNLTFDEQILDIAKKSFNYSRFFNDFKLPEDQAKNVYIQWTKCAFNNKDKYFVISKDKENAQGFILFSFSGDDSIIELIAVDQKYQGKSIGRALINTMESFVTSIGINKIKVGTQVNNVSAMQFYNAMGFKYVGCTSIYHLWNK